MTKLTQVQDQMHRLLTSPFTVAPTEDHVEIAPYSKCVDIQRYVRGMLGSEAQGTANPSGRLQYMISQGVSSGRNMMYTFPGTSSVLFDVCPQIRPGMSLHAATVGLHVGNPLRAYMPNFMFTYAPVSCGIEGRINKDARYYGHLPSVKDHVDFIITEHRDVGTQLWGITMLPYKAYIRVLLQLFSAMSIASTLHKFKYHGDIANLHIKSLVQDIMVPIYVTRGGVPAVAGHVRTSRIPMFTDYSKVSAGSIHMEAPGPEADILRFVDTQLEVSSGIDPSVVSLLQQVRRILPTSPSMIVDWLLHKFLVTPLEHMPPVVYGTTSGPSLRDITPRTDLMGADVHLEMLFLKYQEDPLDVTREEITTLIHQQMDSGGGVQSYIARCDVIYRNLMSGGQGNADIIRDFISSHERIRRFMDVVESMGYAVYSTWEKGYVLKDKFLDILGKEMAPFPSDEKDRMREYVTRWHESRSM